MLSFTDPAVSVVEADVYADLRAWANWTGDDVAKEAALRRGQDYIAGLYNARWNSEWDNDDAPEVMKFAIIEAAQQELVAPGSLCPVIAAGPQKVLTGAGSLNWTVVNDRTDRAFALIPAVEALLAPVVIAEAGTTSVTASEVLMSENWSQIAAKVEDALRYRTERPSRRHPKGYAWRG